MAGAREATDVGGVVVAGAVQADSALEVEVIGKVVVGGAEGAAVEIQDVVLARMAAAEASLVGQVPQQLVAVVLCAVIGLLRWCSG
jgi:hypothetical protein